MPIIMPYTTEKVAAFQVIEDYFNNFQKRDQPLECLFDLLDGKDVLYPPPIRSQSLDAGPPPYNTADGRIEYVRTKWWGDRQVGGTWMKQLPFDRAAAPTTGFWEFWYGDAEGVFRETFIRALSVMLGTPREDPGATAAQKAQSRAAARAGSQHWPVSIIWKCPAPWFEGWVEFQRYDGSPHGGHVTMIMSTPAHGIRLYNAPQRPRHQQHRYYVDNPTSPAGPNGLWVISQAYHHKWSPSPSTTPSPPGQWSAPTLGTNVESRGKVVVVAPSIGDGGVDPGGIPFVP